jgi:hypothetical protein
VVVLLIGGMRARSIGRSPGQFDGFMDVFIGACMYIYI